MSDPNFVILYVASVETSVAFYSDLLAKKPVEASANFAMFALESGVMLGLWARHNVEPAVNTQPGSSELAFTVPDAAAVRATHDDWRRRKLAIAQGPTRMDFGDTFVALDPDGHRLRVFAPG